HSLTHHPYPTRRPSERKTKPPAPSSSTTSTRAGTPSEASSSDSGRRPSTSRLRPFEAPRGSGTSTPPNSTAPFKRNGTVQRFIRSEEHKSELQSRVGLV